ncbi:hypothetical protein CVT25_003433 [Psilocybe cyanescens]|uniref:D-lactate dehydratase n=1 Tax=Psilocybe cyanescens TaxID=93625 RepID=A0A409WM60_PSICY|nr:hypothetical protein CVT25_003433 [Psilocybe cyanescens]
MPAVLFVLTSANKTLTGGHTGWYLPEAAHPYYVLAPHATIDFAAPKGANPPIDEGSVKAFKDDDSVKFLNDSTVKDKLAGAKKLSEVKVEDYDAIFYVGGHGPAIDLPTDQDNIKLIAEFWKAGKIVSAVCHGTAALVGGVDADGKSIFAGRTFTGFSNDEEREIGKVADIPFLLEDKITELGGKYVKADKNWGEKVVVDGQLITGQNPGSAAAIGKALLKALHLAGKQTGWYLPELAHPYYVLTANGIDIDFAAPKGPNPVPDLGSIRDFKDDNSVKFLNDPVVKEKLATAKKLADVSAKDYHALYIGGGHAPVMDLPTDPENNRLIGEFWTAGKSVAAVCHGPAALVNWRGADGTSLFADKTDVPFSLEDKLVELAASYVKADKPFGEKVVVDGKLITGQNPASLAGKQTGWYLPEAAHPYYALAPHVNIDFAAPKGPNPPIDEKSVKVCCLATYQRPTSLTDFCDYTDSDSVKFLNDPVVQEKLATAKKLSDISAKDYDAVFYVGGHAPVIDLPHDADNNRLIGEVSSNIPFETPFLTEMAFDSSGHAERALVNWRDAEGKSIFAGKTVTGLSNVEEEMIDGVGDVPFSLEDKIVELGATYVKADKPFGEKVAVSGKLITGQNPASSVGVGEAIWKAIQ